MSSINVSELVSELFKRVFQKIPRTFKSGIGEEVTHALWLTSKTNTLKSAVQSSGSNICSDNCTKLIVLTFSPYLSVWKIKTAI